LRFIDVVIDWLQFTVTSRKELPNEQFVQEIAKAAEDLYALHRQVAQATAKL
jgi:carnitine O-acetyltransferase